MNQVEITSKRFWLNSKDFLRGLLVAILTGGGYAAQVAFDTGEVHIKKIAFAGLAGGIGYLVKNFFQPAQVKQTLSPEELATMRTTTNSAAK